MNPPVKFVAMAVLLPAALNPSLVASARGVTLSLCGGAGGSVTVPLGPPSVPGSDSGACCTKGCRSSDRRQNGTLK